jgi:hypothetical protein
MTTESYGTGGFERTADRVQLEAGAGQRIVVYLPPDFGAELDPVAVASTIALDAARLAADGWRIMTSAAIPLRHGGVAFGMQGSGFETKLAVMVVYGTLLGA